MSEKQSDSLKEMRERISGYHVYDRHYEKVGKVDDLFVDANDELEYIGLEMGGMLSSKTALIPMEMVRINDRRDLIEIEADKKQIEASPTFGKDEEITSEYEDRVYRHFGLQSPDSSGERGSYGDFEYDAEEGRHEHGSDGDPGEVDTEYGERAGSGESGGQAGSEYGSREPQTSDRRDDSQSSRSGESERGRSGAAAQTGEREGSPSGGREGSSSGGGARVRKRLRVPVRREEVHVDRVETGGGDDELRVRKEVVEGEETVDVPEGAADPGEDTGRSVR